MIAEPIPAAAVAELPIVAEFRRELPLYLRCSPATVRKSAMQISRFLRQQSEPWPVCFTRQNIVNYLVWLMNTPPETRSPAKGNAERKPQTVNDYLKGLKRFARWCVAREILDDEAVDPILKIKGFKATDAVLYAPEPEELAQFLDVAREHGQSAEMRTRTYAMFLLLTDTGLRAHELLAMNVSDVLDEAGGVGDRAQVLGKGGKYRLVPLNEPVRRAIARYLPLRRPTPSVGDQPLWLNNVGERQTYVGLRNTLRLICNKTGVRINLHDFRRYALTQLWLQGIDAVDAMTLSGHSSVEVFQAYIRGGQQVRALDQGRKRSPVARAFQDVE